MLANALIYLCAAVISVPIAKRLGLGAVIGYLLAGVIIGPYVAGLVDDQTAVMHFAEFGVVMMLFLVGLELQPSRLWAMRRPIIGLGGLQVVLTAAAFCVVLIAVTDLSWQTSLAIGLALSLSSTAIALQSLTEHGLTQTQAGTNSFAVLLFQDIAVIPILALLPLLAISGGGAVGEAGEHSDNLISQLPMWAQGGVTLAVIASIFAAGKYLAAPIFRYIAETHLQEIFTAFALLIVIAIALLMDAIGLSAALGSFLAGVVLADSEFRHELEVDIAPFKGLLLGLFFITVGASIEFSLLTEEPLLVGLSVLALIAIKLLVLGFLATIFKLGKQQGLLFAVVLAQGGEFAFVLVSTALQFEVFDSRIGSLVTVVVALSMLCSPLLLVAYEAYFSRGSQSTKPEADLNAITPGRVIIAGYGRFGQIIGRLFIAQGYQLTILDHSPSQIELVRRFGSSVFYGDASRRELLEAAGAADAQLLIIAVDEPSSTSNIIKTAKTHFPHLKIVARARDRRHSYELLRSNIDGMQRETFHSALHLGMDALKLMGVSDAQASRAGEIFEEHDESTLRMLAEHWGDDKTYGAAVRQRTEDLQRVLQSDADAEAEAEAETEYEAEMDDKDKP